MSHAELTERVPNVDRATAYRTLDKLVESGLVVRTLFADRVARYVSPREPGGHRAHPHFHCSSCGQVRWLEPDDVQLGAALLAGRVEAIQITGRCVGCVEPVSS